MAARKTSPKSSLDSDTIPAVAYICGEERLLVEEAFERVRARVLKEIQAPDFNHDRVSAKKESVQYIVNLCRTLPVMSPRRLVEVREAEAINADSQEQLIEYAQAPDPSCTLLLVGEKPDMRLRLFKRLDEAGVLHVFNKMTEREIGNWLERRAKVHGVGLQVDAVEGLIAAIGPELLLLERALEKLALVVGKGGVVTGDQVAEHVATTRVETSFKIVDAMAAGHVGDALQTLLSVLDGGEPALRMLGALAYAQRQSIRFLDLLLAGEPTFQAARAVRLFRNEDQAAARVRKVGREALSRGLAAIADADRALKGSPVSDEEVMVNLLLTLSRLQGPSNARGAGGSPGRPSTR